VITPEVERLVTKAKAAGTVLAVIELLCRLRPWFRFLDVAAECERLAIPMRGNGKEFLATFNVSIELGFCERDDPGVQWKSKIAGRSE